ncbi:AAA family ATPase [Photobacterium iliopiscarium]|uniref:ATPase AAA-type core domain-containing protein n=1 Tax=Photobacterium iliopiscarium TaxID=56192 RepID=A0A2T3MNH9_9GAMM|nr:AAA family ATPase [Photobacterium iliopiscarium]PSV98311.1 hypothetical protein C9I88_06505 [Photobacterium iliopiscarium]
MNKISLNELNLDKQSTIFIGENGGGKSTTLGQLLEYFNSKAKNIIAISNCLNDKFTLISKNVNYMSVKHGNNSYKNILFDFFSKANADINQPLSNVLIYCGYSDIIGIKITWGTEGLIEKNNYIRTLFELSKKDNIIWIPLGYSFPYYQYSSLIKELFSNINHLSKNKIVLSVNFFLEKKDIVIDFEKISSGEASQISTLAFISANIDKNSVILIDEPENSLHPKWQREYINKIVDIFYFYNFNIFISTHSPLIINETSDVYDVTDFKLTYKSLEDRSIEALLWNYFNIVTPENEFLSRYLTNILDEYKFQHMKKEETLSMLHKIKKSCTDKRQQDVIDDLCSMIISGDLD